MGDFRLTSSCSSLNISAGSSISSRFSSFPFNSKSLSSLFPFSLIPSLLAIFVASSLSSLLKNSSAFTSRNSLSSFAATGYSLSASSSTSGKLLSSFSGNSLSIIWRVAVIMGGIPSCFSSSVVRISFSKGADCVVITKTEHNRQATWISTTPESK